MKSLKFFLPLIALFGALSTSHAQSYGGVGVGYSRIGVACGQSVACSAKRLGGLAYVGVALPESLAMDLGVAKLASFEVGMLSFGTKSVTTETFTTTRSGTRVTTTRSESRYFMDANGAFAAMVADTSVLTDDLVMSARFGIAYITSSLARRTDGVSVGAQTTNRGAPYLGLGVEYKLGAGLSANIRLDASKYGAEGRSGSLLLTSAGVSYQY